MSFTHLHLHTEYSLLDGLIKIKKLTQLLKETDMDSCAITDHGNMYGAIEFFKTLTKAELKPIIGCEIYISPESRLNKTSANRKSHHLILLAKNLSGYQNLIKIVSIGHTEGFYYKPRIDWEILEKYHQDLVCLSGCAEGEIAQLIINEKYPQAKDRAQNYQQLFGHDFYLEIQRHPGLEQQETANNGLVKISRELGIPLVATNDAHYLKPADAFAQDVLLMINTQTTVNDKKRLSMADTPDFYVKTPEEMISQFTDLPDAIKNATEISNKCELEIEIGKWYFPKIELPPNETAETYLQKNAISKAQEIYPEFTDEVKERLEYELNIICSKGYAPYFLVVKNFINWCEENGTPTNTRGSAAGSLVSYALGITSVDPLKYQLPFERFLNKDRPSPPDIDLDVADNKRQYLLHHIVKQYGEDKVAQICTFGRMMARGAVRDTARVLGYEYAVGDRISKIIPMGTQGFPMSIDKALSITPELKQLYDTDPDAKKILDTAKQIEGCARHISVHACGVVISPKHINHFLPTQLETGGNKKITQYEWHACEDVGLLKYDILGIDNLSFLGETVENIKKTKKINIDIRDIPLDDHKTFQMLSKGHTMGVFQLSGEGMTKWLKELKPNRVDDLMAMVALYRPGPMSIIPEYIARKNDPSKISYFDPKMEKFLKKSYGLLVYQDDCLYTAIELAGYSWIEVDKFRRAIGKKIPEEMATQKEKFIQGCINNGYTKKKAEEIFKFIEPFTSYGFNKAHAASYGMLAYRTAFMKANYPVEYMGALLTSKADDTETVASGIDECRQMGIIVSAPDINLSQKEFSLEENPNSLENLAIRIGFDAIKNVGDAAITNIINERNENGPFHGLTHFCLRVDSQKVNKKVLESLIKVGAFDAFGERNAMLSNLDKTKSDADKLNAKKNSGQFGLFETQSSSLSPQIPVDTFPNVPPMDQKDKLTLEKQLLGIYITENPIAKILKPFANSALAKISSLSSLPPNSNIKICGIITRIKTILTKKNSSKMAFVTIEDETGKIEVVVFPKTFETSSQLIIDQKPIYLEAKTNIRDGNLSLIADTISASPPNTSSQYDFVINVPKGTSQSQLMELNRLLKNNPNGHRGLLVLETGKHLSIPYGVKYTPDLQNQIDTILAKTK